MTDKLAAYLQPVLDWLDAGAQHTKKLDFNMNHFSAAVPCGTTCCIAGAIYQLNRKKLDPLLPEDFIKSRDPINQCYVLGKAIGMTRDQVHNLFFAGDERGRSYDLDDIPPELAAAMVREFLETGEANWPEELP